MTIELESRCSGERRALPVADWSAPATEEELAFLHGVTPAVLDVGCGPGRIAAALAARGVAALGIDVAPAALAAAMDSGAAVLARSVFDPLPGEGRWGTVLLFDGNVGIGGDPVALLRRCGQLLAADGRLVVEVEPPGLPTLREEVRIRVPGAPPGPWFDWARVGADGIAAVAAAAGLGDCRVETRHGRHFARVAPAALPRRATQAAALGVSVLEPSEGR